jgi:hypothetical protein
MGGASKIWETCKLIKDVVRGMMTTWAKKIPAF